MTVNGTACSLATNPGHSVTPLTNPQPTGCPQTGQPIYQDPFAGEIPIPADGAPGCSPGSAGSPSPCSLLSGSYNLNPGTYYGGICIGAPSGSSCTGSNCATDTIASYSPNVHLHTSIDATTTTLVTDGGGPNSPVQVGDVIQIDSEQMLVTNNGPAPHTTLTVQRGYNNTVAAAHNTPPQLEIYKVTGPATTANVTMAAGTYIMAGGGFAVCGNSTLSAPNVLIYNTDDSTHSTGNGALGTVDLNTTGSVTLGPQTSGSYTGLTIFQDPNLEMSNVKCDMRDHTNPQPSLWDVELQSMGSSGSNGALGSISGTIYLPAQDALFSDEVSGTADVAVLSGCIYIDGANSTFDFDSGGGHLFGVGEQLSG